MNKFFKAVNDFRVKHEPEILMAMGLSGLLFAIVWTTKATVEATHICDELKVKENKDKLTAKDVVKATWKLYLPVVISTSLAVPCIVAGNRASSKRYAALAAAYTISETALKEYQEKTKEVIGEAKEKKIQEAISTQQVAEKKVSEKEVILTGDGDQLFYEPLTGRYFKSSWNAIQKACNELNEEALGSTTGSYTLNEWLDKIGLSTTEAGELLGWCTPTFGHSKGLLKISMTTTKTQDDKPCGAIYYDVRPYNLN